MKLRWFQLILNPSAVAVAWLWSGASLNAQQPAVTPAVTKETVERAVITGSVVFPDGEPIANCSVSINRVGTPGGTTLKVAGNGSFKSEPLEAGLYRVVAFAPGYILDSQAGTGNLHRPGDSVILTLVKGAVITGKVTTAVNAPVVAANVRAIRVRDQNGKALAFPGIMRERITDDRGIYRIYGLPAGAYVVAAGGNSRFTGASPFTQYDADAPTYSPSSVRDTAVEVTVNNGDEVTEDIQYRNDPGHSVSGKVNGAPNENPSTTFSATISLLDVRSRSSLFTTSAGTFNNYVFAVSGVPDGDYEITAALGGPNREVLLSGPKRITVQGADVSGVDLTVIPPGSIEGRVVLESDPRNSCAERRGSALRETIVSARRFRPEAAGGKPVNTPDPNVPLLSQYSVSEGVVDGQGTFTLRNLYAGNYQIDPRDPASGWYLQSITRGAGARATTIARDWINLKPSERVTAVTVTLREGASQLRGHVSLTEGQSLPSTVRVYLVPAEPENADNTLRFYEASLESKRSFTFSNLAPGKYWVVARPREENELGMMKSIRLDPRFRAKVFSEASEGKKEVSFKPCEQIADYELPFALPPIPRQ
jgi:hypothetical protein